MTELEALAARDEAETKLAILEANARAAVVEKTLELIESPQPVAVPWSEYPAFDTWGMAPVGLQRPYIWTSPDDRSEGRYLPLYENEFEARRLRAESRSMCELFPVAKSLLRKLSDYVMGTGWDFTVRPKKAYDGDPIAQQLAKTVQACLDKFLEINNVVGNLDREMHEGSRIDGNAFPTLYADGDQVRLELTDPGCILEPAKPAPLERMLRSSHKLNGWWHGVHTLYHPQMKRDDVTRPLGYHAVFDRLGDQWDYLPACRVEHIKRNVGTLGRVGVPDFTVAMEDLKNEAKIRRNTAVGAAILAAIVMIREHAAGTTRSSIESMVADSATTSRQVTGANSSQTRYSEQTTPGTVKDIPNGMVHKLGALGQLRSPIYIEVDQHLLRIIGNVWSMPEYMSTGDASNANYSSTLVAESPFVKYCEQEQAWYGGHFVRLLWKALRIYNAIGVLRGVSWEQVRTLLEINGEYTSPASRDKLEQTQVNKILSDSGILSDRTWAADAGLDLDEEIANGAEKAKVPGFDPVTGAPLLDPNKQLAMPVNSKLESLAARAIQSLTESAKANP